MVDVKPYIDKYNISLWEKLSSQFNSKDEYYGNYLIRDNCTIYVPHNELPSPPSFSHELLHLYLPSKKIFLGGALRLFSHEHYPHSIIFDEALCNHISNCSEHIKMFPIFLQMGYPAESFLKDFNEKKISNRNVCGIKNSYKRGLFHTKYNIETINWFIGLFFAAKADVNPQLNYDVSLSNLKQIDHKLYSVIDGFWNDWQKYNVELKREIWEDDYNKLVEKLIEGITLWSENKVFTI